MIARFIVFSFFFFFNDTATTEIYTLSLHDALPIAGMLWDTKSTVRPFFPTSCIRSEEHTSELQSLAYLVCRLLLEKKKKQILPFFTNKKKIKRLRNVIYIKKP